MRLKARRRKRLNSRIIFGILRLLELRFPAISQIANSINHVAPVSGKIRPKQTRARVVTDEIHDQPDRQWKRFQTKVRSSHARRVDHLIHEFSARNTYEPEPFAVALKVLGQGLALWRFERDDTAPDLADTVVLRWEPGR